MKKSLKLTFTIELIIPSTFEKSGYWSRIEMIDDYVHHWLNEGYYIDDHIVELPNGIKIGKMDFVAFPEKWWKEFIPESKWKESIKRLKNAKLILEEKI